ncbi:MAG: low specificity L-threonine aldolase [Chthoniobacterales bacterium]
MTEKRRHFASDNNAGIYPEVLEVLAEASHGHVTGYGADSYTAAAQQAICELFETECAVFFVSNGTAANCLGLAAGLRPFSAIIAHQQSHLETDECNAVGFFNQGVKVIGVGGRDAKIDPDSIEQSICGQREVHASKPRAISITNATELGTVYRVAEIRVLTAIARDHNLIAQLDGARFANAIAHLGCAPAELTWKAGIDVLSFGGTKNGLAFGEAIVFFRTDLAADFAYRMKQSGQLASKMRFLAAPWLALLKEGLWLRRASHANAMAERLCQKIALLPGIRILYPREANSVFAKLSPEVVQAMYRRGWRFYTDVGPDDGARLMCSWDTTEEDVDSFARDLGDCLALIATHADAHPIA